ncbi:TetR/AcrR family transcriptional regulator [Nocardioides sp. L-11A]|uniref:TetR/AcrR family transcriptional regulator n=1 Tax=Nocardioides sp. L-11A TaxID=3043848 RepID=UPI00249B44EA|nr:helix-turn-helix domain-containing protein [Nocardioides sp. L-11A]
MKSVDTGRTPDEIVLTPAARRILDVASALFYARGITAVGVDTIAAESGVTKRTLYDRFGSKDALVASCLDERNRLWWARLDARLAELSGERVLAAFDCYLDTRDIDRGCAFLNAAAELPREHPAHVLARAHKRAVRERLGELLALDHPDLEGRDELAEHLFLLLEGAVSQRGLDDDDRRMRTARDLAASLLPSGRPGSTQG